MQFGVICDYKFFKHYKLHLSLRNFLVLINSTLQSKSCYYLY